RRVAHRRRFLFSLRTHGDERSAFDPRPKDYNFAANTGNLKAMRAQSISIVWLSKRVYRLERY
ncbi:MAG: hypothetical protein KDE14_13110, partial [Rhodobacteraceae bacterium]|nr:hypothetical protein [Paracoccaceae bacterium]